MASLTVRQLDEKLKKRLRLRAAKSGRSVEDEVRTILREAAEQTDDETRTPVDPTAAPTSSTRTARPPPPDGAKKVLLIIGGGIAAYKSLDLIRRLKERRFAVRCIMTDTVNVERALRERNEALETADSIKIDFVHHVSYELRSPLTNIIGFANLLGDPAFGRLNPKQAEYLGYITASTNALLALINNILDLATIDAGAMALNLTDVDIRASMPACTERIPRYPAGKRSDPASYRRAR